MKYFLSIDQGTHASRACLFDEAGNLVSEQVKEIALHRISHSHIEQDADEVVCSVKEVVKKLIDDLNDDLKDISHSETNAQPFILSCGIATQRSSVLAWSKDGTALSPVISWQDTRGADQLEELKPDKSEIQRLSGLPLSAHYGASKMYYLLNSAACRDVPVDELRLSPLVSYLLFHLLDEHPYIVDHTNAQRTQLFELATLNWSSHLTELFNVPIKTLPGCVPAKSNSIPHGTLAGTDIPVKVICGDQNAAIFGEGKLATGSALVNVGSGAFVLTLLDHYMTSKNQLNTIAYSDEDSVIYAREGTINSAGSALTWIEEKYDTGNLWQRLPAWLREVEQPPVFINTIGGLGSPWWNNQVEPEFITIDGSTIGTDEPLKDSDLPSQAVAVVESIIFMICTNLEIMKDEQTITRLRICGGLSRLDGLCQRLADLSGLPVDRADIDEATSRGAAWLAAGKPDIWSDIEIETFQPTPAETLIKRFETFRIKLNERIAATKA